VEAGDRLEFIESEQGFLVVAATRDIRSLKGIVGRPKKPVTLEDMNSAIEKMGRTRDRPRYERRHPLSNTDDAKQSPIATRLMEKTLSTEDPGFYPARRAGRNRVGASLAVFCGSAWRRGSRQRTPHHRATSRESAELVWRASAGTRRRKRISATHSSLNLQLPLAASAQSRLIERRLRHQVLSY